MKTLFFSIFLSIISHVAFSQNILLNGSQFSGQLNTIATAVPFLRIPPDARSTGMGDAGIATSPDANSLHWNTAKLAFSEKVMEFSASYTPWLRSTLNGINYAYAGGYRKMGERHVVGGSVRYFSYGNFQFTNEQGDLIREFSPKEFEIAGGYAYKLSSRSAVGLNAKFIHSNLNTVVFTTLFNPKPATAGAVDLSYSYFNSDVSLADYDATWSFGATVANMGNKMAFVDESNRDFIPTNLGLGTALKVCFNEKHALSGTVDFNKLLVPTAPMRNMSGQIISGRDDNVGVLLGMIQSFYDAPGNVVINNAGQVVIEKNSRLKEEINEITIGGGVEYLFMDLLALRAGYFHQHQTKGNQKYVTFGVGAGYGVFGIDVSYLAALNPSNPLANTVRFSLKVGFPSKTKA